MPKAQLTKRRKNGAGYSVPAAADVLDVPYKTLREAVRRKQAKTIHFGGQERMTQKEVDRLRELFSGEGSASAA
jgi:hypothetical protein